MKAEDLMLGAPVKSSMGVGKVAGYSTPSKYGVFIEIDQEHSRTNGWVGDGRGAFDDFGERVYLKGPAQYWYYHADKLEPWIKEK